MFDYLSEKRVVVWCLQAKLGDANKFYYDEKLKKWVEEGVDPTPDVAPPPPPPTTSSFVGSIPGSQEEGNAPPQAVTSKPGTPPLAPSSSNYYSNRRQAGVRSRCVSTCAVSVFAFTSTLIGAMDILRIVMVRVVHHMRVASAHITVRVITWSVVISDISAGSIQVRGYF